jgi:hypothetical protein
MAALSALAVVLALAVRYWSRLCSSWTLRSTLPPKQISDYQVEFGGEIRLACGSGPGIGAHHQQATFRKRPEVPAGQMTQPAPYLVAHDGTSHGLTDHEPDAGRLVVARLAEQVARDQMPSGAVAAAHCPREL